jgi:hypothetical protein
MRSFLHTVTRLLQEAMQVNGPSVAESPFTQAIRVLYAARLLSIGTGIVFLLA